jgi:hypothetical protein
MTPSPENSPDPPKPPRRQLVLVIQVLLGLAVALALYRGNFMAAAVSAATLGLTMVPMLFEDFYSIRIPVSFTSAIVLFVFCTLFLGEVGGFYERFWWWDLVLHSGSAVGFGLMGFVVMFILLKGDKLAGPPLLIAMFSFCFAVSIGAVWEIFEFAMDQFFGLNMQKSGLVDTMFDLIVDSVGALFGAGIGYLYLKGQEGGPLTSLIREFVERNQRLFDK